MRNPTFDPYHWFWVVGGDLSRAWSSAASAYVVAYSMDRLTYIDSESSLADVLAPYGLVGPVPWVPKTVTALQGMRAIKAAGLVPAFLAWKGALDPVTDFEITAFLEKAQNWVYDDPILNAALVSLGVANQKAALFTLANSL